MTYLFITTYNVNCGEINDAVMSITFMMLPHRLLFAKIETFNMVTIRVITWLTFNTTRSFYFTTILVSIHIYFFYCGACLFKEYTVTKMLMRYVLSRIVISIICISACARPTIYILCNYDDTLQEHLKHNSYFS